MQLVLLFPYWNIDFSVNMFWIMNQTPIMDFSQIPGSSVHSPTNILRYFWNITGTLKICNWLYVTDFYVCNCNNSYPMKINWWLRYWFRKWIYPVLKLENVPMTWIGTKSNFLLNLLWPLRHNYFISFLNKNKWRKCIPMFITPRRDELPASYREEEHLR